LKFKELQIVSVLIFMSVMAKSGTIILKDGVRLSGVKLISVIDGNINILKGKREKSYNLKKVKAYYATDFPSVKNESFDTAKFDQYKVAINDVNFKRRSAKKDKLGVVCEVGYTIHHKNKDKKLKRPYFYLFVLLKKSDSSPKVARFCWPHNAEPKGSLYDEMEILKKVKSSKRQMYDTKRKKKLGGGLCGRKKTFNLNNINIKNIIAWHLEVWGDSQRSVSKSGVPASLGASLFLAPGKEKWWRNSKYYNK